MPPVPPPPPAVAGPPPTTPLTGSSRKLRYFTGGEIRVGDRVRYKGTFARVVFVSNGDDCTYAIGYEGYRGSDAGVLICDDDGATRQLNEEDEQLELVHR